MGIPINSHFFSRTLRSTFGQSRWGFVGGAMLFGLLLTLTGGRLKAAEVPRADAGLGPCTADFTVTDANEKPIFNARIHVKIKHGRFGMKTTELEVGTNNEGKARFQGLPSQARKSPLEFNVRHGDRTKTVLHYPTADCNARFPVTLEDK